MTKKDYCIPTIGVLLLVSIAVLGVLAFTLPAEAGTMAAPDGYLQTKTADISPAEKLKTALFPAPKDDEKALVQIIRESVFPLNQRATLCLVHIINKNPDGLKTEAELLEQETVEVTGTIEPLNLTSSSYANLSKTYTSALTGYTDVAATLQRGLPATDTETSQIMESLIQVSNKLISVYNSIEFDDTPLNNITAEAPAIVPANQTTDKSVAEETITIEGAFERGTPFTYLDSKEYNRITATVPLESGKFTRSLIYMDEATKKEIMTTPKEGNIYYYVLVSYIHAGHLDGKTQTITPPKLNAHVLTHGKKTYKPLNINAVNDGLSIGKLYTNAKVDRLEKEDGLLIYEVPEDFTRENSYLTVNFGTIWGKQTWKLWD